MYFFVNAILCILHEFASQDMSPHSEIVNPMLLSDIFRKSRFGLFKLTRSERNRTAPDD